MSPATRATKKAPSKDKSKVSSEPSLEKHLSAAAVRQLQEEEALFQGHASDTEDGADALDSVDDVNEESSASEFTTPKAPARHASSKTKAFPAHQPAQATPKVLSRKRTVDQSVLSPTPIPSKTRRSHPPEQPTTSQHPQELSALISLVNNQSQEILSLKEMVMTQSKEISDIKKLVKKLSINSNKISDPLSITESMASHLRAVHAAKTTSFRLDDISQTQNAPKIMQNSPYIALNLSQCNLESV